MQDNIFKQATASLNAEKNRELENAFEEMSAVLPHLASLAKNIYDESKDKGFSETQSFDIAKEYIVRTMQGK